MEDAGAPAQPKPRMSLDQLMAHLSPGTFASVLGPALNATLSKMLRYPDTPPEEVDRAVQLAVRAAQDAVNLVQSERGHVLVPTSVEPLTVEQVAREMHEAQRAAVEARLVVRDDIPVQPFIEWDALSEVARAGRMIAAEALVARLVILPRQQPPTEEREG